MTQSYRDDRGRVLFVDGGISGGRTFGTYYRKPSGSLARLKSSYLPLHTTFQKAQSDLDIYARRKKFSKVDPIPEE